MDRFGVCRSCHGTGQLQEKDPILLRVTGKWVDCGECHGSGESGNAIDFLARDTEEERFAEMQEILRSEGKG